MQQDISPARADRLAHPDFAGSLSDAHQHDIHYAYATDDQAYTRNREHADEQHAGKLIPNIVNGIGREYGEVVGFVECNLAAAAQQLADFVDDLRDIVVREGLDADPMLFEFGMQLPQCTQGHVHLIVFGILASAED